MVIEKRIMDFALEIKMLTFKEIENEGPAFASGAAALILMSSQNINLFYHSKSSTLIWT